MNVTASDGNFNLIREEGVEKRLTTNGVNEMATAAWMHKGRALETMSLRTLDIFRPRTSSLRCGGRVPRKISNARFRDMISKLCKVLRGG